MKNEIVRRFIHYMPSIASCTMTYSGGWNWGLTAYPSPPKNSVRFVESPGNFIPLLSN